ncbi:MAG: hypothetical protein LBH05_05110 [Deferribacteraceae bacterium]|jgi:hypothetical protein|nr:hypothetical protein [Deferribacteraceae bacterium]
MSVSEIVIIAQAENRLAFNLKKRAKSPQFNLCGYKIGVEKHGSDVMCIDEKPLFIAQTFCPTCETLIKYGQGGDWTGLEDSINAPFENIEKSFNILRPLISMFPVGKYDLKAEELYPVSPYNEFFWNIKEYNPHYRCRHWDGFIVPTQSPKRFNMERVNYYRGKHNIYAVALKIKNISYLLDGHHKASAATLDGRKIRCLTIQNTWSDYFDKVNPLRSTINQAKTAIKNSVECNFPAELIESASKFEVKRDA